MTLLPSASSSSTAAAAAAAAAIAPQKKGNRAHTMRDSFLLPPPFFNPFSHAHTSFQLCPEEAKDPSQIIGWARCNKGGERERES